MKSKTHQPNFNLEILYSTVKNKNTNRTQMDSSNLHFFLNPLSASSSTPFTSSAVKPQQKNISPCKFILIIIDISFILLLLITCKPPCPDPPTTVTIHHTNLIWRLFPLLQSLRSASHVTPHVSHTTASLHKRVGSLQS